MSRKPLFVLLLLLAAAVAPADEVSDAEHVADATEATVTATDEAPGTEFVVDTDEPPGVATEEGVTDTEPAAEAQVRENASEDEGAINDTEVPKGTKDDPKLISGMSVLGNREAPKSLVIVPWKSSQIGDTIGIAAMLDDSKTPVDREVFTRALIYYEIRSETKP